MNDWTVQLQRFLETLTASVIKKPSEGPGQVWQLPDRQLMIHGLSLVDAPGWFANGPTDYSATATERRILIREDVWQTKTEVVKSRLRALAGQTQRIPARLTQVRRINKPVLDDFLRQNHLQIPTAVKYKYGLFLPRKYLRILKDDVVFTHSLKASLVRSEEVLVAVASFSGGKNILRDGENYRSFELIRFANVLNVTVVGGLDKLLKAFIKDVHPDDIMTYADRDWSDGRSYERLGFQPAGVTPPQPFWIDPLTFERHYESRLAEVPEGKGWVKVYNTGSGKFLKKLK